jgi:transcriptional regulator with XRE-family HTH domain
MNEETKIVGKKGQRGTPTEIDKQIGRNLKQLRTTKKMTQTHLSKEVGVSHQQIQKYENGKNRISSTMLYIISKKLNYPIHYFFQQLDNIDNNCEIEKVFSKRSKEETKIFKNSVKTLKGCIKTLKRKLEIYLNEVEQKNEKH